VGIVWGLFEMAAMGRLSQKSVDKVIEKNLPKGIRWWL
jgi:hypothetical protein